MELFGVKWIFFSVCCVIFLEDFFFIIWFFKWIFGKIAVYGFWMIVFSDLVFKVIVGVIFINFSWFIFVKGVFLVFFMVIVILNL